MRTVGGDDMHARVSGDADASIVALGSALRHTDSVARKAVWAADPLNRMH